MERTSSVSMPSAFSSSATFDFFPLSATILHEYQLSDCDFLGKVTENKKPKDKEEEIQDRRGFVFVGLLGTAAIGLKRLRSEAIYTVQQVLLKH